MHCDTCALLGYYAASSSNFLPTFRDNLSVPSSGLKNPEESPWPQYGVQIGIFFTVITPYWGQSLSFRFLKHDDRTDRLSRNVGKKLPLLPA